MSELAPDNLSKSDFADILRASYLPQSKAASYLADKYNYDKDLSTIESKVFINKETGAPLISSRGSTRVSDFLYEDPRLATYGGQFFNTRRVNDIQNLSKATQEKYGVAPTLVGHSLGGYLAEKGAQATPGSQVYTYNKAAGLPSIFSSTPSTQTDYRTTYDLPSALSVFQYGNRTTLPGSYNPIASHYLDYLK